MEVTITQLNLFDWWGLKKNLVSTYGIVWYGMVGLYFIPPTYSTFLWGEKINLGQRRRGLPDKSTCQAAHLPSILAWEGGIQCKFN